MIASLPMYARPELVAAHNQLWALIRQALNTRGIDSPRQLSQHSDELSVWQHPDLLLSQTCGLPYKLWLHTAVGLVGTPDYGVEGCPPGYYRSAVVVRADDDRRSINDFESSVLAFNQRHSHSGYGAAYQHAQRAGCWFNRQLHTGQHRESARAVADSRADIAFIDAISFRQMQRYDDFSHRLRVLEWTEAAPGLPLITSRVEHLDSMFAAVGDAISVLPPVDRESLGIRGIVTIDQRHYLELPDPSDASMGLEASW